MKIHNLTLILLLFIQAAKGQSFDKTSNWTIIKTNIFDDTFYEVTDYKIDGDTLIEDKNYSIILKGNNFYSALRETEDNKMYVYFPDIQKELLIYDFDWSPDDTIYHQVAYDPDSIYIKAILGNSIDSVQLLDGNYYKCVKNYSGDVLLIKGIGDTRGFFISTFELPSDGSQFALLCFYLEDILVYRNPEYSNCNISSIHVVTDTNLEIKLYPNPSNHTITIEFSQNHNIDTLRIFDLSGRLNKTYSVNGEDKIEVQNLSKGMYILSASSKGKQILSGKIIISP